MIMKTLLRYSGKWTPGGAPGVYVTRVAVGGSVEAGLETGQLRRDPSIESATCGNEFITVRLKRDALARVALDVAMAGTDCVTSDALRGITVAGAPRADLAGTADWRTARQELAAELTATLAAAAGATVNRAEREASVARDTPGRLVKKALEFAGADAIRFAVASSTLDGPPPDPEQTARHVLGNPAYAVRYAHAAAVAVLRWAGTEPRPESAAGFRPSRLAEPEELALLDALSWLPERVAVAARRGRPDVFARYLATLANKTIDTVNTTGFTAGRAVTIERLWLARAARTGLAAGLGLLGITAPGRL